MLNLFLFHTSRIICDMLKLWVRRLFHVFWALFVYLGRFIMFAVLCELMSSTQCKQRNIAELWKSTMHLKQKCFFVAAWYQSSSDVGCSLQRAFKHINGVKNMNAENSTCQHSASRNNSAFPLMIQESIAASVFNNSNPHYTFIQFSIRKWFLYVNISFPQWEVYMKSQVYKFNWISSSACKALLHFYIRSWSSRGFAGEKIHVFIHETSLFILCSLQKLNMGFGMEMF